ATRLHIEQLQIETVHKLRDNFAEGRGQIPRSPATGKQSCLSKASSLLSAGKRLMGRHTAAYRAVANRDGAQTAR
ncbi:hypothetical protein, partial [Petrimonas mucosa]|uniref:hypothetical protein n=1 Tax=Petrimonas mucosa TaxID=1642646 RepID=UPI0023F10D3A